MGIRHCLKLAASVQPSFGVKQLDILEDILEDILKGCSLSPLLFAIHLADIDSVADGVKGALTGTPNFFGDPHAGCKLSRSDDLSFISNDPYRMQSMLNKLRG